MVQSSSLEEDRSAEEGSPVVGEIGNLTLGGIALCTRGVLLSAPPEE